MLEGLGELLVGDLDHGGSLVVIFDDLEEVVGFLGSIDGTGEGIEGFSEGSVGVGSSVLFVTEGLGSLLDGGEFLVDLILEVAGNGVIGIDLFGDPIEVGFKIVNVGLVVSESILGGLFLGIVVSLGAVDDGLDFGLDVFNDAKDIRGFIRLGDLSEHSESGTDL